MKIGFIGCGNMGSAMVSGILKKELVSRDEILVSALTEHSRRRITETFSIPTTPSNREVAVFADILFLAVKPQFYQEVLIEIRDLLAGEQLLVGIAPGKTLQWLEETTGKPLKIVRMMPNTPAQAGEGMTGFCVNDRVTEGEIAEIRKLTESFGRSELVPERLMDAVCAVSGSSPAFVFLFLEAMADAAVAQGMPRKQAYTFAAQAVLGSAKLLLDSGKHPGELKDMVCSPAGTTIEGVRTLEKAGFRSAVFEALQASAEKGKRM